MTASSSTDLVICQQFDGVNQGGMVRFGNAVRGAGVEQFVTRRAIRQRHPELFRICKGKPQICLVQFDPESRLEVALEQTFAIPVNYTAALKVNALRTRAATPAMDDPARIGHRCRVPGPDRVFQPWFFD